MRPVRALGWYCLFVFGGGSLIAPWLYESVQAAAGIFPALEPLAAKSFPRYVNRCLLLFALIGLVPLVRAAGLNSWAAIGLPREPRGAGFAAWGFLFGLVSLCCVAMVALAAGARGIAEDRTVSACLGHGIKAGLTAALVAPLEEIVFRGVVFGSLRQAVSWRAALVISSGVFAVLHFLQRAEAPLAIGWSSGLAVLAGMMRGVCDLEEAMPALLNLFLVGAILALAYQRSGSLYFSIGLHAGWIVWLKSYGYLTDAGPIGIGQTRFFGTNKMVNGWLAFILLNLVFLMIWRFMAQNGSVFTGKGVRE